MASIRKAAQIKSRLAARAAARPSRSSSVAVLARSAAARRRPTRVTGGQGRISVTNQASARASGQFGERCPDASHCRRESEDVESLPEVITAFIAGGGLQRGQLPDAVRVAEQGLVIQAPGPAAGQQVVQLRSCRCQVPAPPKGIGRREDSPEKDEQQDD